MDRSLPDGLIEGGTEQLAGVFTETHTRYSFAVGTLESPQTLTALDLPHLHTIWKTFNDNSGLIEQILWDCSNICLT